MKKAIMAAMAVLLTGAAVILLTSNNTAQSAVIPIEGMCNDHCAEKITSTLENLEGVAAAEVSLQKAEAKVRYDAQATDLLAIEKAISSLGYSTPHFAKKISFDSNNAKCSPPEGSTPSCCASQPKPSGT